jgi:hypothetical protein
MGKIGIKTIFNQLSNSHARTKSFVTLDILFNIALRGLKFQVVTRSIVKKNPCGVLSAR